jgi:hypothetical protein
MAAGTTENSGDDGTVITRNRRPCAALPTAAEAERCTRWHLASLLGAATEAIEHASHQPIGRRVRDPFEHAVGFWMFSGCWDVQKPPLPAGNLRKRFRRSEALFGQTGWSAKPQN